MMASDNVIDVNEADFEYEVVNYSQNTPVIVDFWATWCVPCKTLGPILERLAQESNGAFRLARVDVDANPNLAIRYNVRSIPSVKAFQGGQVVSEFSGALPEVRVREFLSKLAPSASQLMLEKAGSLLQEHQWASAEQAYRQALVEIPENPAGKLGLAKALLAQGHSEDARKILRGFPASREYSAAQLLLPLAEAMNQAQNSPVSETDDLAPAFRNSLRLISRGNFPAALDGLLDILRQDKQYQNGLARQIYLAILELLGAEDQTARQYRSELATVLFA